MKALDPLAAIVMAASLAGLSGCGDSAVPARDGIEPVGPAASSQVVTVAETEAVPQPAQPPAPAPVRETTFDDIKLDLEKDEPFVESKLTDSVRDLDGSRIRIRGYILPSFQQKGIRQFVLVRDNLECCFGPGAALFDCIVVEMQNGASTEYTVRPVAVQGRFTVQVRTDFDDKQVAIYHLDGESVE